MIREIYLDNNSTTRPLPEVRAAMLQALDAEFGNPSSAHSAGDRGRDHLRLARQQVGTLLGVDAANLIFTSGGTESNNMVLLSVPSWRGCPQRIVTTQVEHSSILKAVEHLEEQGVAVERLPVGPSGRLDLEALEAALSQPAALVSVQWVNNETGVVQPMQEIADLCRSHGARLHTDAAQAVGKLDLAPLSAVDFATLTAHKFHGPQGVGAVYARDLSSLRPLMHGGPQEHDVRGGTENVPGIVGLGAAAELRHHRRAAICTELAALRDELETLLLEALPQARVNGDVKARVCNSSNLCFPGVDGEALVARLDLAGVRCSQSSACTNRRPEPSYVLRAMGLSEADAYSSVRLSVSVLNTREEIQSAAREIISICRQLGEFGMRVKSTFQPATGVK